MYVNGWDMYVEDTLSNMEDIPSYPGALSFKDIIIWLISPLATVSKKIYCSILLPIKVTGRFHTWRNAVFMNCKEYEKGYRPYLREILIDQSIDWQVYKVAICIVILCFNFLKQILNTFWYLKFPEEFFVQNINLGKDY